MSIVSSKPLSSLYQAEQIAGELVRRGISMDNVSIRDEAPAFGHNLGAGVTAEAVEALIIEHEHDTPGGGVGSFIVEAETLGDTLNERIALDVFAQV